MSKINKLVLELLKFRKYSYIPTKETPQNHLKTSVHLALVCLHWV